MDQAVNEDIDGAEVMRLWLDLPADQRGIDLHWERDFLASVASPMCFYQSAMEALQVINDYIDTVAQHAAWDQEEEDARDD